jgi:hypothetical protein
MVGFYGPTYHHKRRKAWINLCALLESFEGPWLCFGDFNSTLDANEKKGGRNGSSSASRYLSELMFDLGVVDLGFVGAKFTWCNNRWGKGCIRERLDRGIANPSWRVAFPRATVLHLGAIQFDHCPILIDTNPVDVHAPRPFRFEAMWANDPRCFNVVNEAWQREVFGSDCFKLYKKQYFTTMALQKWNKEVFGHCQSRINDLTEEIGKIQCGAILEENFTKEAKLQNDLNIWLSRNESMWRQKSRKTWLKDGDRNSKFFHISTIIRRKKNSIDAIRGEDGVWRVKYSKIRDYMVGNFQHLFSEEPISFPSDLENLISPMISDSDNILFCEIPSPLVIKETLFGMQSLKSPGPDGLPPLFYKKYWKVVGQSVIKAVQNFFISSKMLREVNNSYIVLIPKIQNPSTFNHFRPISLCNTIYKIISKLIVDRLRSVLPSLISPAQSAFIPSRWIVEN